MHVGRNARVGRTGEKRGPAHRRPASESTTANQPSLSFRIWAEPSYRRTPTSPNNYLGTTKTNEKVCTVKPCPDPREERLAPQPRNRIIESSIYVGSACEGNRTREIRYRGTRVERLFKCANRCSADKACSCSATA